MATADHITALTTDGGLKKRLVTAGRKKYPPSGSKVRVHYTGTLLNGTKFDSSRDRPGFFEFTLGRGQVIRGWDLGIASMTKGEVCVLTCRHDYAYGERGHPPTIPPRATLQFEVELFGWQEAHPNMASSGLSFAAIVAAVIAIVAFSGGARTMATLALVAAVTAVAAAVLASRRMQTRHAAAVLDEVASLKASGTDAFGQGRYAAALELYADAADVIEEPEYRPPPGREEEARRLLTSCWLNRAGCALKLGLWSDAERSCTALLEHTWQEDRYSASAALEHARASVKARYRRGHARMELDEYDAAKDDLREALQLDPKASEARALFAQCAERQAAHRRQQLEAESELCRKMF